MGTAINHAAAMKRLEALFNEVRVEKKPPPEFVEVENTVDEECDVHGKHGNRRGSLGHILPPPPPKVELPVFQHNFGHRRGSVPALNNNNYYRYGGDVCLGFASRDVNTEVLNFRLHGLEEFVKYLMTV